MNSANSGDRMFLFGQNLTKRQSATFRTLLLSTVLGAAVGAYFLAPQLFGQTVASPPPPAALHHVSALELQREDRIELRRSYTGELHARRRSELAFERSGRVTAVLVDDGARVAEGALLARLDTETLQARRAELEAQLAAARARLDEMVAGPRAERIAAAQARVAEQEADLEYWQRETERLGDLVEKQAANQKEFADARTQRVMASARLEQARQQLRELETGTRTEQLAAQRAEVARLVAAVRQVTLELEKSELRAPFAGAVALRLVDEGQVVDPRTPIVRLIEDAVLEARVGVPAEQAAQLAVGGRRAVRVGEAEVEAEITAILPAVDAATRTVTVVLTIAGTAAEGLTPGRVARLTLQETRAEAGYWVPIDALVKHERGLWAVYALEPLADEAVVTDAGDQAGVEAARVSRRLVEVLHTQATRAFVRGLLEPGERIVSAGAHKVVPNQRVHITRIAESVAAAE